MIPTSDVFELVWRVPKNVWIHEFHFLFRTDEDIGAFELIDRDTVYKYRGEDNRLLRRSLPQPRPPAEIRDCSPFGSICRIYMDTVSLCQKCGSFHSFENVSIPWVNRRTIDETSMWAHIESRVDRSEFIFQECQDRRRCHDTVRFLTRESRY